MYLCGNTYSFNHRHIIFEEDNNMKSVTLDRRYQLKDNNLDTSIYINSVFRNGMRLCVRRIPTVMVKLTGRNLVIQTVCGL